MNIRVRVSSMTCLRWVKLATVDGVLPGFEEDVLPCQKGPSVVNGPIGSLNKLAHSLYSIVLLPIPILSRESSVGNFDFILYYNIEHGFCSDGDKGIGDVISKTEYGFATRRGNLPREQLGLYFLSAEGTEGWQRGTRNCRYERRVFYEGLTMCDACLYKDPKMWAKGWSFCCNRDAMKVNRHLRRQRWRLRLLAGNNGHAILQVIHTTITHVWEREKSLYK
jgi:hypothetical protein